jgi:hypothetical protein
MASAARDSVFWASVSLVFAFLLFFGIDFGIYDPGEATAGLHPGTWPRLVTLLLLLSALYLTRESVGRRKKARAAGSGTSDTGIAYSSRDLLLTLVVFVAYYIGTRFLGIAASSLLVFLLLTRMGGEKRLVPMLCIGAALAAGLYYFFLYVAAVPMPPGPFGGII